MNAAVWRYHPATKKFEIYAEGTSNPWGIDWRNTDGQFILACCVIPHLYHIVPGGVYQRQAGQSFNTHAYGYIKEISDHTFHKESGWAHAGLLSLDVPIMPERFRNSVIFGSIHGNSLKQNILRPDGSSYIASRGDDFLQSGDKNFRPINLKWGPHGDIYLIDWHDQNPCHQAAAGSWDYSRGRVYRIQLKGRRGGKPQDIGALGFLEVLDAAVESNDPWTQRTALRLCHDLNGVWGKPVQAHERGKAFQFALVNAMAVQAGSLKAWWSLYEVRAADARQDANTIQPLVMDSLLPGPEVKNAAVVRGWLTRLVADTGAREHRMVGWLTAAAKAEPAAGARRELASAAVRLTGTHDVTPLVHALMAHAEDVNDPLIPHLIWLAYEKVLAKQSKTESPAKKELAWLKTAAPGNNLVREQIVPRAVRRVAALGKPSDMALCIDFIRDMLDKDAATARAGLDGLTQELAGRVVSPPEGWDELQRAVALSKDQSVRDLAAKLAVNFGDPKAVADALAAAQNTKLSNEARIEAIRRLATLTPPAASGVLLKITLADGPVPVRVEATRALGAFDTSDAAKKLVGVWKQLPALVRDEAVRVMASRKASAKTLLTAMRAGTIDRNELSDNTVLKMKALNDGSVNGLIETAWGRTRTTPAELLATIDQTRADLNTHPGDFARGKAVFEANCAKCHAFEGRGQSVGPALSTARGATSNIFWPT